nr:MAG TPA: hypothetical protein [Bacteriophage sp.]
MYTFISLYSNVVYLLFAFYCYFPCKSKVLHQHHKVNLKLILLINHNAHSP